MKRLPTFCCIILFMYFENLDSIWFGVKNENCQYVQCEGEDCPNENEICPYKNEANTTEDFISPLTNAWPDPSPDEQQCVISNYSWRSLRSIKCLTNTTQISCDSPLPPGTTISYTCPDLYRPASHLLQCQSDGTFSKPIACVPRCGVTYPERVEPLILHGSKVEEGQWPWAAAIFLRDPDNTWKFRCGGTLVSDSAVITATHCVWRRSVKELFIKLGHLPSTLPAYNREYVIFQVKRIYLLPVYRHRINKYNSNIAILVLKTRLKLTKNILPVCLPGNDTAPRPYSMSIVTGWGLNEEQEMSQSLYYMKVPIIDVMKCLKNIDETLIQFVSYTTFCAGYLNGTAACNNDGGGGLMTQHDGKWVLQGVLTSFGQPICQKRSYSVYTKVELYISWIKLILDFENTQDAGVI